jgi:hypothetical protein
MPRGEYGPRYAELPREERLKDALQTLGQGIDSILTSETFAGYLRTLARFHSYSFGNVLLIRAQRQVKKGEQGTKIHVPYKLKKSTGRLPRAGSFLTVPE